LRSVHREAALVDLDDRHRRARALAWHAALLEIHRDLAQRDHAGRRGHDERAKQRERQRRRRARAAQSSSSMPS
jgi:hypothetical protein